MKKRLVIAIDGPAASGKGTLARKLAAHYGLPYLDTGKLYRAVAFAVLAAGERPDNHAAAIRAAQTLDVASLANLRLAEEQIGKAASIVASIPEVRAALLDFQRHFAARPEGAVLDGRDIGTVICPNADIKFFIEAAIEVRAKRRYNELREKAYAVAYDAILQDLAERDMRDKARSDAPLLAAPDAIVIDTSAMNAEQVLAFAVQHIES